MRRIRFSKAEGFVQAQTSKSWLQRVFLAAAASGHRVEPFPRGELCDDCRATLEAARTVAEARISVGGGDEVREIDCGESGFCFRALPFVAAGLPGRWLIGGKDSLLGRPHGQIRTEVEALWGRETRWTDEGLWIGARLPRDWEYKRGPATIEASETSQKISGALLSSPLKPHGMSFRPSGSLVSSPYVGLTVDVLLDHGVMTTLESISPSGHEEFRTVGDRSLAAVTRDPVPDLSGATFFMVAGAMNGGNVRIGDADVDQSITTPDREVFEILRDAGIYLKSSSGTDGSAVEWLTVSGRPSPFVCSIDFCPDLFPPLLILAASCRGESVFHGVSRLRGKESDRLAAGRRILDALGVGSRAEGDRFEVDSAGTRHRGSVIDLTDLRDHRMVMAASISALLTESGVIIDPEPVAKSYPGFFDGLRRLGCETEEVS